MIKKPVLFIDADDTLWECNLFFREAMHRFCGLMNHHFKIKKNDVYEMILLFEHKRLETYGYGSYGFYQCLLDVYAELEVTYNHQPIENPSEDFRVICDAVLNFKIELLPNVIETLAALKDRNYELHLVTKGEYDEQRRKIENSNLKIHFDHWHIMSEKDEKSYVDYLDKHGLNPEHAVMIGNSPNSDIHPPRKIGMKTVYVPHKFNWELEVSEVFESDYVKVIKSFDELLNIYK